MIDKIIKHKLEELLDLPKLQSLLDSLYNVSAIPSAIIDVHSNVLTASGWQDICTKYHRVHPETRQKCLESDAYIFSKSGERPVNVIYKCPNGLIDTATPIIVDNEYLGNIFTGQLFLEKPDVEFFKRQARKYGFDEDAYIDALRMVPVISHEKLEINLDFLAQFTKLLAEQGLKELRQFEAKEALREGEEFLNNIFESIRDGINILDRNFNIIRTNKAFESVYSHKLPLVGKKCYEVSYDKKEPCEICPYIRTLESGSPHMETLSHKGVNGEERWREIYTFPLMEKKTKEITGVIKYIRDITERKLIEDELVLERSQLLSIFDSIDEVIYISDPESHEILFVNKALKSMCGNVIGQKCYRAFQRLETPCSFCTNDRIFGNNEGKSFVWEFQNRTNQRWYRCIDKAIRWTDGRMVRYEMAIDITDHKQAEDEFLKSQKLESIGILAGGIAHDFNNLLQAIFLNVYSAVKSCEPGSNAYYALDKTEKIIIRARNLTHQLLTFSKGGAPVKKTFSLSPFIEDSVNFALSGSNVKGEISMPEDLWPVEADEGQLHQVVQNLVINAIQAMPDGGTVKVKAENMIVGNESDNLLNKGEYVVIYIRDRGNGIPKEHMSKIFDPFFTTKKDGSGLGLASVYSIIKKHGGIIRVESKCGAGTTFSIHLPAACKKVSGETIPAVDLMAGAGRLLVMDDDKVVRNAITQGLRELGYEVCAVNNGKEAIAQFIKARETENPFDVVILDLTVPGGMGGIETIKKLHEIDHSVKAIVSSGYANDQALADYKNFGFAAALPKPYKMEELSKTVHEVKTRD